MTRPETDGHRPSFLVRMVDAWAWTALALFWRRRVTARGHLRRNWPSWVCPRKCKRQASIRWRMSFAGQCDCSSHSGTFSAIIKWQGLPAGALYGYPRFHWCRYARNRIQGAARLVNPHGRFRFQLHRSITVRGKSVAPKIALGTTTSRMLIR